MLPNTKNISAWFKDAATRHPDILHSASTPHFFELEWDEMMQNGTVLSGIGWNLVLEDYTERFRDNDGDYISVLNVVSFMVLTHVPHGNPEANMAAYAESRRIAKSIVAKLKADELDACDADVPADVVPPALADLSTLQFMPVNPPMFDHAFGTRATITLRYNQEATFSRDEVNWTPLP